MSQSRLWLGEGREGERGDRKRVRESERGSLRFTGSGSYRSVSKVLYTTHYPVLCSGLAELQSNALVLTSQVVVAPITVGNQASDIHM